MSAVRVYTDWVAVVDNAANVAEVFIVCDDCREAYLDPPYATFDSDECMEGDAFAFHGDQCTGNMCPDCAGPYIEPDWEDDPRRPAA